MSGILILIAITTSGPTFLIALGGAIILYGLILKLYLQTAQDLKRLEGISKFVRRCAWGKISLKDYWMRDELLD